MAEAMEQKQLNNVVLSSGHTQRWMPQALVLALGVLVGTVIVVFTLEESIFLFFPRLGVRGIELLTSGLAGVLAAIGVVIVLRGQETLVQRVNTIATERQQLEDINNALIEHTQHLSVTNHDSQQQISRLQQVE